MMDTPQCEFSAHAPMSEQRRGYHVRFATENDRFGLFKLAALMHRETDFRHFDFDPKTALDGLGDWIHGQPNRFMLVAEHDFAVVGMLGVAIRKTWFGADTFASEELFYVHPGHRGSRAAYYLMRAFVEQAKERGADHLRAGVATSTGKAAERLYERFGMFYVGGNFSAHIKEKSS
jgi:GNAT superfamily N-acetyltransferase